MENFHEDFEREAQKDFVYLLEHRMMLEQWIQEEMLREQKLLPAKIVVIDEDQVLKKQEDEIEQPDILPF